MGPKIDDYEANYLKEIYQEFSFHLMTHDELKENLLLILDIMNKYKCNNNKLKYSQLYYQYNKFRTDHIILLNICEENYNNTKSIRDDYIANNSTTYYHDIMLNILANSNKKFLCSRGKGLPTYLNQFFNKCSNNRDQIDIENNLFNDNDMIRISQFSDIFFRCWMLEWNNYWKNNIECKQNYDENINLDTSDIEFDPSLSTEYLENDLLGKRKSLMNDDNSNYRKFFIQRTLVKHVLTLSPEELYGNVPFELYSSSYTPYAIEAMGVSFVTDIYDSNATSLINCMIQIIEEQCYDMYCKMLSLYNTVDILKLNEQCETLKKVDEKKIYHIVGATFRSTLGIFYEYNHIQKIIYDKFAIDYTTACRLGLPVDIIENRADDVDKMIYINDELFRWVKDIENDILSKTIFNANAIISLKDSLRPVTIELCLSHPSFQKFYETLLIELEHNDQIVEMNYDLKKFTSKFINKFIDYYMNVAMNDIIDYNSCLLRQSNGKNSNTQSFRQSIASGEVKEKLFKAMSKNKELKEKLKKNNENAKLLKEKNKALKIKEKEERKAKALAAADLKLANSNKNKKKKKNSLQDDDTIDNDIDIVDGWVYCDGCEDWFQYPAKYAETIPLGDELWYCHDAQWFDIPVLKCPSFEKSSTSNNDVCLSDLEDDDDDANDNDDANDDDDNNNDSNNDDDDGN